VRVSHYWFGWGVFAIALAVFFWVTDRMGPAPRPDPATAAPIAGTAAEFIGLVGASAILIALPAVSTALRALNAPPPLDTAIVHQPRAPWSALPPSARSSWEPHFVAPDQEQRLLFADGAGDAVEVYAVAYRTQSQEAKLYGSQSSLLGRYLRLRGQAVTDTASGAFRESAVTDRYGGQFLIWSRYEVGRQCFVGALPSQLWFGLRATVSNPPARLVAARAVCRGNCQDARHLLQDFVASGGVR